MKGNNTEKWHEERIKKFMCDSYKPMIKQMNFIDQAHLMSELYEELEADAKTILAERINNRVSSIYRTVGCSNKIDANKDRALSRECYQIKHHQF